MQNGKMSPRLSLEEMDESHWMKFTNTRHLSPLVMYIYPNYCLLSSCSPFSSYITYFNWNLSATILGFFFCLFVCFCLLLSLPYGSSPLLYYFSVIVDLLPLGPFFFSCHITASNQGFCLFCFPL